MVSKFRPFRRKHFRPYVGYNHLGTIRFVPFLFDDFNSHGSHARGISILHKNQASTAILKGFTLPTAQSKKLHLFACGCSMVKEIRGVTYGDESNHRGFLNP
jgi:hypothetical protein